MSSCSDNVQNRDETDVDCGGLECSPCPSGSLCNWGSDCASGVCNVVLARNWECGADLGRCGTVPSGSGGAGGASPNQGGSAGIAGFGGTTGTGGRQPWNAGATCSITNCEGGNCIVAQQ